MIHAAIVHKGSNERPDAMASAILAANDWLKAAAPTEVHERPGL
jgi:hypothetical protein